MSRLRNNDTFELKLPDDLAKALERLKEEAEDTVYTRPKILTVREKKQEQTI
jgi:hypothetical protein